MSLLFTALLVTAAAQDRAPVMDSYRFDLKACDGVRARTVDERPPDVPRSRHVVVELRNTTASDCTYRGLALKGWLEGTYTVSRRRPDGEGFTLPAGGVLKFKVAPRDPDVVRSEVRLQIAPERGIVLLDGRTEPTADPAPPSQ